MSGAFRLAAGGRIDRAAPLRFRFDGRPYEGLKGDTLASALLANGMHLVGRSLKYHRPRGIVAAGADEPNAIVQVGEGAWTQPNARATEVELYDGLVARNVTAWPGVGFDLGAAASLLSPLLVAGFYYKTFMAPGRWWRRLYEPALRRMAGLGRAPAAPDPDVYDKRHAHADVLVVGAGPAGLAAALAAARTGARVMLADEQAEFGGALLSEGDEIDGRPALEWVGRAAAELASLPEVVPLPRATVFGYYDHNYLAIAERRADHLGPGAPPGLARRRLWRVRARRVVLATGAHERPLVFADNDRPGVMLASAVRAYLNRYAVAPGRRAVVFTNNDDAYRTAFDLADAGIELAAVVDARSHPAGERVGEARRRGIEVLAGSALTGTRGRRRVAAVEVRRLDPGGSAVEGPARTLACDLVAVSGGWSPAVHLFSQSQGTLRFDEARACFVPDRAAQAVRPAGAANGTFTLAGCLAEGLAAGAAAARLAGFGDGTAPPAPLVRTARDGPIRPLWFVPSGRPAARDGGRHFVDLQADVTAADIRLAAREGLDSVEHVKRYTAAGMGTDQGKTANVNALALLSQAVGRPIAGTGTTTFRPPYTPVGFGLLAGRDRGELFDPVRVTPMHAWHVAHGAVFEDVGQWKRPLYYPRAGEDMAAAVARECRAARGGVAALDATTLGKIDIRGPDAAAFLDRVYTNAWARLGLGQCRYGMMCGQDGMVLDDGVTTRLAPDRFLMTTTTGNAARVLDWLEEWLQTEWPGLRVYCTSVTEQWATVAIVGPRAREVLGPLAPGLALDNEGFPFMTLREAEVAGIPARVFRISFTGELSFEVNVPAWHGLALWEAVMRAGEPFGITPYGTEAMHVLRAEKGFIIVGQETDGTVTPLDLGMDWIVSRTKDFIGKRSLLRPDASRPDRKQLVGLLPEDPGEVLPEGAQLVAARPARAIGLKAGRPIPMIGHVTSSYSSAALGRSFALALVKGGRGRIGATVYAPLVGRTLAARIVEPVFYDREGKRRNG
ncbi:MAG: sarcosine oxidase subunit alpha family protein [Proteobacteria bacterium]|nr:sarcosine oxidase subunit alpha family protein [Pseudomonadota bacterium]